MNLVMGILCLWLGAALIWVASHGIQSGDTGFGGIWQEILDGIGGRAS